MASTIPEQYRAVDPFASYNSGTVNQLTEMRTRGRNVLDTPCGMDVVSDSTSPLTAVVVKPGYAFKDDVMIKIEEDHVVDFTDPDSYITYPGPGSLTVGYYYIVLDYTYIKSRPAPQASIKLVTPDQRNNYDYANSNSAPIFLKAIQMTGVGPIVLDPNTLSDYDPSVGYEDNRREYTKEYAGAVSNVPTFDECRDTGRFAYDTVGDEFWFGYSDRWERLGNASKVVDTANVWTPSGGSFYYDVDISSLSLSGQDVTVSCRDTSDDLVIIPEDIDLGTADTVRIWMPVNTVTLEVTVVG